MAYTANKLSNVDVIIYAGKSPTTIYKITTASGSVVSLDQATFEALFTDETTKAAPKPKPAPRRVTTSSSDNA